MFKHECNVPAHNNMYFFNIPAYIYGHGFINCMQDKRYNIIGIIFLHENSKFITNKR